MHTGRENAGNTQKLKAQPQKGCRGKTGAVLILKQVITSQIITLILQYTSSKISFHETIDEESRRHFMLVVEEAELLSFFGLFSARDLLSHNLMSVQKIFSANVGHPVYSSIMNCNCFEFIKKVIGFDNALIDAKLINLQHCKRSLNCSIISVLKTTHLMTFLL